MQTQTAAEPDVVRLIGDTLSWVPAESVTRTPCDEDKSKVIVIMTQAGPYQSPLTNTESSVAATGRSDLTESAASRQEQALTSTYGANWLQEPYAQLLLMSIKRGDVSMPEILSALDEPQTQVLEHARAEIERTIDRLKSKFSPEMLQIRRGSVRDLMCDGLAEHMATYISASLRDDSSAQTAQISGYELFRDRDAMSLALQYNLGRVAYIQLSTFSRLPQESQRDFAEAWRAAQTELLEQYETDDEGDSSDSYNDEDH